MSRDIIKKQIQLFKKAVEQKKAKMKHIIPEVESDQELQNEDGKLQHQYTLQAPMICSDEILDDDVKSVSSYNSYFDDLGGYEDCLDMDVVDVHNVPDYDLMLEMKHDQQMKK